MVPDKRVDRMVACLNFNDPLGALSLLGCDDGLPSAASDAEFEIDTQLPSDGEMVPSNSTRLNSHESQKMKIEGRLNSRAGAQSWIPWLYPNPCGANELEIARNSLL